MKTFKKPLSTEEEVYYIHLLREGTEEEAKAAKEILIERNMRLVAHIAKKYQNSDEDMEDLISTGTIGLIKAVLSFDAGKGRLATYACRCIDNELLGTVLSDREREILLLRYGLCGKKERSQREIGQSLGISRSYVSRIEKKALLKLKNGFTACQGSYG